MSDALRDGPDFSCLFAATTGQHGYFTSTQARARGFRSNLLNYHVRTGKFVRVYRGVYRLRDYPSSPREEVVAAWLAVGKDRAVVSHDSALDLHDLSDVIPNAVHLTVPRVVRHPPAIPGVIVHTTTRDFLPQDIVTRDGLRVTSPARTILDAAEAAVAPEQIEMAVRQAISRGLTTRTRLEDDARQRSRRVYDLVTGALERESHGSWVAREARMVDLTNEQKTRIDEAVQQIDQPISELLVAVREIVSQDFGEEHFKAAMRPALAASYAFGKVLHYLQALRRADDARRQIGQQISQKMVSMPDAKLENVQRIAEIRVVTAFLSGEQEIQFHLMATSASQIARLLPYAAAGASVEISDADLRTLKSFKTLRDHFEHLDERLPGGKKEHWIVTEDAVNDTWRVSIGFETDNHGRILLNNDIIDVTTRGKEAIESIVQITYEKMRTSLLEEARTFFELHPDKVPAEIRFNQMTMTDYDPRQFGS